MRDVAGDLMRSQSALGGLPPDAANALMRRLYPRTFPAGTAIIRQGATDKDLYVLGHGQARVQMSDARGQTVEVGALHPGDVFGEWSLLTNRPRAASVIAVTDVEAYVLHKADYEIVMESYLSLVQYLGRALSIRQREYAGLLAGELNLWAAPFGGMRKDEILSSSFLTVAAAPDAALTELVPTAGVRLWAATMESVSGGQYELNDCIAVTADDGEEERDTPGAQALAWLIRHFSSRPGFDAWRQVWLDHIRRGLEELQARRSQNNDESVPSQSGLSHAPEMLTAFMEAFPLVLGGTIQPPMVEQLNGFSTRGAHAVEAAYDAHLAAGEQHEKRRMGYTQSNAGRREVREAERQLAGIERLYRTLPREVRPAASPVLTIAQLLSQFFLWVDERHPTTAALPYGVE